MFWMLGGNEWVLCLLIMNSEHTRHLKTVELMVVTLSSIVINDAVSTVRKLFGIIGMVRWISFRNCFDDLRKSTSFLKQKKKHDLLGLSESLLHSHVWISNLNTQKMPTLFPSATEWDGHRCWFTPPMNCSWFSLSNLATGVSQYQPYEQLHLLFTRRFKMKFPKTTPYLNCGACSSFDRRSECANS